MLKKERGFLLISLYMLLPLLLIMGGTMVGYAWSDVRASLRTQASTQAFYFAEAGLDNAIVQLRNTGSLPASPSATSVGNYGNYLVVAEDLGSNRLRLTSTGTSLYLSDPVTKSLESIVKLSAVQSTYFKQAVFGNQSVTLSNSARTDSYISSNGAYSAGSALYNGDVGTNGTVTMNNSSEIRGDVYVAPDGDPENDISTNNSASYTGTAAAAAEAVTMQAVVIPGNLSNQGSLTVSGSNTLTLSGGTYWYSSIQISNSAKLIFTGPTTLYVTNGITLSNSAKMYASGNRPSDLLIQAQGSTANLSNSTELYGALYAPNAHVTLSNSAALHGVVMANRVTMSNSSRLHYDEDLPKLVSFGGGTGFDVAILSWGVKGQIDPSADFMAAVAIDTTAL